MYCPNCATSIDGLKFCRSCGQDVRLVPQAMSGKIEREPVVLNDNVVIRRRHLSSYEGEPNLAKGVQYVIFGAGLGIVAKGAWMFSPGAQQWWFWLLLPAFLFFSRGVAEIVRVKQEEKKQLRQTTMSPSLQAPSQSYIAPPGVNTNDLPAVQPGVSNLPGSIVEGTTRNLDPHIEQRN